MIYVYKLVKFRVDDELTIFLTPTGKQWIDEHTQEWDKGDLTADDRFYLFLEGEWKVSPLRDWRLIDAEEIHGQRGKLVLTLDIIGLDTSGYYLLNKEHPYTFVYNGKLSPFSDLVETGSVKFVRW